MNITLFGATGKTGPYLIEEGLKRGYKITVFVRDGTSYSNNKVKIVRGEITNPNALKKAIMGADAVISALGPTKFPHPSGLPITKATQAIIDVMQQEHVRRLLAVSTGTAIDSDDSFDFKIRVPALIIKFAMPKVYYDIIGVSDAVRGSNLDWTLVRAGFLKNIQKSNYVNAGPYGKTKHSWSLYREDLAKFMFDQIESTEYSMKAPGVSSQ